MIDFFRRLFKATEKCDPPKSCSVVLSTACCLECRMCRMWKSEPDKDGLSFDECSRIVREAANLMGPESEFILSGGEPLMVPFTFDLIKEAKKSGLKTVMPTNGFLLGEENAKKIADSGLDEIFISLDSQKAATHDKMRGVDGVYERVQKGIGLLSSLDNAPRINHLTIISGLNLDDIEDHVETVHADARLNGIYFQSIAEPFFACLDTDWRKHPEYSDLWPEDIDKVCRVIDRLIELKKKNYIIHNPIGQLELFKAYFRNPEKRSADKGCALGERVLNIDPTGNVSLCCFTQPIGNVRDSSLKDLWYGKRASADRKWMKDCLRNCHNTVNCFFEDE